MDPDSQEPGVDFNDVEEDIVRELYLDVGSEYWCYGLDAYVMYTGFYYFNNENEELFLLFTYYRETPDGSGREYGVWLPESEVDL